MSFAITLGRFSFLPGFLETDNGEPKKAHWLGSRQPVTSGQGEKPGGQKGTPGRPPQGRVYRDLASITLGEVQAAYQSFENQLAPSPYPAWIGTNMFCMFDLRQRRDEYRPAAIFGRVRTCHPSDGYINNIRVMELLFPRVGAAPDVVLLHNEDIDTGKTVQAYGLRVNILAAPEEAADLKPAADLFLAQGLVPEFDTDYLELLNLREQDRDNYPWFYVAGSRWFASIPDSVKPEIRESLRNLVQWGRNVFDYHPRSLEPEIRSLNWELGFNPGLTEHFLIAPETPGDTVKILASTFERMLQGR